MVICGNSSTDGRQLYMRRLEKVKFGAPIAEAFCHDIPPTLLVLLLKVNKEGVYKKDIWRAPGNQAQVRKLIHIMQSGQLVNISNFSVYTAASVIKKFLAKLPGSIFGQENERRLFGMLDLPEPEKRREAVCRVVQSLPIPSQHLLVLLFGTFRLVSDAAVKYGTRMSPEAIGVCVAPSLFHTCIHDGHRAHLDDVVRFRMASQIVTFVVNSFGYPNLFPRESYEYYARITGRTLHIDENWLFSFRCDYMFSHHPDDTTMDATRGNAHWSDDTSASPFGVRTGLPGGQITSVRLKLNHFEKHEGTFGAISHPDIVVGPSCSGIGVESHACYDSVREEHDGRLACSLDEPSTSTAPVSLDELRKLNHSVDCTRSLSHLCDVHVRQTRRMQTRSEWFLSPVLQPKLTEFKSLEVLLNKGKQNCGGHNCNKNSGSCSAAQVSPISGDFEQNNDANNNGGLSNSATLPVVIKRIRSWRRHYSRSKTCDDENGSEVSAIMPMKTLEIVTSATDGSGENELQSASFVSCDAARTPESTSAITALSSQHDHFIISNAQLSTAKSAGSLSFTCSNWHSTPLESDMSVDYTSCTPLSERQQRELMRKPMAGHQLSIELLPLLQTETSESHSLSEVMETEVSSSVREKDSKSPMNVEGYKKTYKF